MLVFNYLLIMYIAHVADSFHSNAEKPFYDINDASRLFKHFVRKFKKNYENQYEYKRRYRIFKANLKKLNKRNEESDSVTYGISKFFDMIGQETRRKVNGLLDVTDYHDREHDHIVYRKSYEIERRENPPKEWDWRNHSVVSSVKDQGYDCSSCWAFTAAGAVESKYAITYNELITLSAQQILDCSGEDFGCDIGGDPSIALEAAKDFGGIVPESKYPYKDVQRKCSAKRKDIVAKLDQIIVYKDIAEDKLKSIVYFHGPIIVAMQAGEPFYDFKSGIADSAALGCRSDMPLEHAALIVGYGKENGTPYWIVKNSFGPEWGEEGYFRLKRGVNTCNIRKYLVEPVLVVGEVQSHFSRSARNRIQFFRNPRRWSG